jgi:hypothetical protein
MRIIILTKSVAILAIPAARFASLPQIARRYQEKETRAKASTTHEQRTDPADDVVKITKKKKKKKNKNILKNSLALGRSCPNLEARCLLEI